MDIKEDIFLLDVIEGTPRRGSRFGRNIHSCFPLIPVPDVDESNAGYIQICTRSLYIDAYARQNLYAMVLPAVETNSKKESRK